MRTMCSTRSRLGCAALAAVVTLGVAGCDFLDVVNPGPVQEEFLQREEAQPALVSGMGRALSQAQNWLGYTGAAITREIHPSGSTGSFGITNRWQRGELSPDDDALDTHWEQAQRARWLAESGIAIIEEAGAQSPELLAQAELYAGYANRLLGEHMCEAVIDGGAAQPNRVYFERAKGWFDRAAQSGSAEIRTAAIAGRAAVNVFLDDWSAAVADAAQVTDPSFEYLMPYHDVGSDDQRNRIQWASAGQPYKAHTLWSTVYDEYFAQTNDPRVAFERRDDTGDAAIDCCGVVAFWPQLKYTDPGADIVLSSSAEMRLIEAENMLRNGDWQGALAKMNALRAAAGVAPWTAASEQEAWTHLKRERGIVLWLEGRRIGDMRRWQEDGTPGALHPLEQPGEGSHLAQQDLCFPIPPTERDTNINIGG
ncbi:MAG: RagB/SusD family nutrient uptake outer membrane protein [Longimicrobiales bacterium]